MINAWTGGQYSVFRVLLGAFLMLHFAGLFAWTPEVFGAGGLIAQGELSPLFGLLPSPFWLLEAGWVAQLLVASGVIAGGLVAIGYLDRFAALWAWYALACLFCRDPLIANPSLPFVGWMLLFHVFTPRAPYGSLEHALGKSDGQPWRLPRHLFFAAWAVLAIAYSYSGYTKLLSPSWVSGDTIAYVLQNPLTRDTWLRVFLLSLPPLSLKLLTWGVLVVELLFVPLALSSRSRPIAWSIMLLVQFGFLVCLNFADLTTPMLLVHLLTFDPAWLAKTRSLKKPILLFDGQCGLCHAAVRFVFEEDTAGRIRFAPLQSEIGKQLNPNGRNADSLSSMIFIDSSGTPRQEYDAFRGILSELGGLWLLLSALLRFAPATIGDRIYRYVGVRRRGLLQSPEDMCPLVPGFSERLLKTDNRLSKPC